MHIHGPQADIDTLWPDALQDILSAENPRRLGHQESEQAQVQRREVDFVASTLDAVPVPVEFDIAHNK